MRVELPSPRQVLAYQVEVKGVAPRTTASSSTFRQEEFAFQAGRCKRRFGTHEE